MEQSRQTDLQDLVDFVPVTASSWNTQEYSGKDQDVGLRLSVAFLSKAFLSTFKLSSFAFFSVELYFRLGG